MIKKVSYTNYDFAKLCKCLDDEHKKIVAEQRRPNANCLNNLEKYTTVFIEYIDNNPIGCIAITDTVDEIVELGRVFVLEQYRNRGIATKLLETAEKQAKLQNAKKIVLDTYERFSNAVKLYKKLGFHEIEKFDYLKDSPYAICMEKKI